MIPLIIFSEQGSSDLLRIAHQSFLAKSGHQIYYFLARNRLKKAARLIYYVLGPSLGGG